MENLPAAPNSLSVDRLLGVGEMGQFLDLFRSYKARQLLLLLLLLESLLL